METNVKSITQWAEEIHDLAKTKGWWEKGDLRDANVLAARLALIHSEVSEALEAARGFDQKGYYFNENKPEGLMAELADIVIRVFDLAQAFNNQGLILEPIEKAIQEKHTYNKTREYRHGGKKL